MANKPTAPTVPTSTLASTIILDVLQTIPNKDAARKISEFQLSGNNRQALEVMRLESMTSKLQMQSAGISAEEFAHVSDQLHYEIRFITHLINLSDANIKRNSNK
jgi:hypothetical protein